MNWPIFQPISWSIGLAGRLKPTYYPRPLQHVSRVDFKGINLSAALEEGERGAIIFPTRLKPIEGPSIDDSGLYFDPDIIRANLMLFERLDYPGNTILQLGPGAPEGLEDWTGLQRSWVQFDGYYPNDQALDEALIRTFEGLNGREPGRWAFARGANSAGFPEKFLNDQSAFQLRLINALPFPDRSVPYDDVLSYRSRRRSELLALRHHIEEIAIRIGQSGSEGLEAEIEFERFQQALADHAKAIRQENFAKRGFGLDVKFSFTEFVRKVPWTASAGGIVHATFGMPIVDLALGSLMAVGSAISIEPTSGPKTENKQPTPFEYVLRAGDLL